MIVDSLIFPSLFVWKVRTCAFLIGSVTYRDFRKISKSDYDIISLNYS